MQYPGSPLLSSLIQAGMGMRERQGGRDWKPRQGMVEDIIHESLGRRDTGDWSNVERLLKMGQYEPGDIGDYMGGRYKGRRTLPTNRPSAERTLENQLYMTGGYINPERQAMWIRDYFRTGAMGDPFGSRRPW